jgi:hypothetical protein
MSSTDQSKPGGKSGQRSRKVKQQSKKPDQRRRAKPDQQPDLRQDERELIEAEIAPTETLPIAEEVSTETFSITAEVLTDTSSIAAEASTDTSSIAATVVAAEPHSRGALVPIDAYPVAIVSIDAFFIGFQAVANAYREYTRRSLEDTLCFVEKFTAVRSFDKAIEVQSEFASQACGTFVTDSQKIWRLYSELARQVFRPFERLVVRVTQTAR